MDSPEDISFYTGLPNFESFMSFMRLIDPGENAENIRVWSRSYSGRPSNAGRPHMLTAEDQLVLVRLRLGLFERDLAYRFKVSVATVSRICTTWISFIYLQVGQMDLWFAGYLAAYVFGTATAHAPDVMQCVAWSSFPRRVMEVTDSARVGCPIFLADNSHGFPFASSTLTLDPALDKTNVTLDGPITDRHSSTTTWSTTIKASPVDSFISGRGNSGVGIMLIRCLFITQFQPGDSVMADKGFKIQDLLSAKGVALNIPPFLQRQRLTEEEVRATEEIASLRTHSPN
ncbi:hypothetical protein HPB50_013635 [Hyalomma asiaticum]|uniref:Uncharacterized protein n=1 Tax=Hyalomma asiaticum TaxID=266040 RepID=A0ACB7SUG7_HYAAI|nr:hypothetical protein HPB50_013635 [Hyalomma asiaticum]